MSSNVTYQSTRGGVKGLSFGEAVLMGLPLDRGLLVPSRIPTFSAAQLEAMELRWKKAAVGKRFQAVAFDVMRPYIGTDDMTDAELVKIVESSYATFRHADVTPVTDQGNGLFLLELFHGPTFAFKDVALQFLGNVFEHLLGKRSGDEARLTILGATSGDTGSAAMAGVRGKKGIECFILFPDGKVSPVQAKQMTTFPDANIHACPVRDADFDDCQNIVKALMAEAGFKGWARLGAVNSINWARILAQIVYYFHAYFQLREEGVVAGDGSGSGRISFSVPTGNFGDILAGFYAKKMGLPVEDLVVATNDNDILHRFFTTGTYRRDALKATIAPAMDISISSNFERFIYHMCGDDAAELKAYMDAFEATRSFTAKPALLAAVQAEMKSATSDEAQIRATIRSVYDGHSKTIVDPHTAVGVCAADQIYGRRAQAESKSATQPTPVVCLACAHWAKFPDAVLESLRESGETEASLRQKRPQGIVVLDGKPARREDIRNSKDDVRDRIYATLTDGRIKGLALPDGVAVSEDDLRLKGGDGGLFGSSVTPATAAGLAVAVAAIAAGFLYWRSSSSSSSSSSK